MRAPTKEIQANDCREETAFQEGQDLPWTREYFDRRAHPDTYARCRDRCRAARRRLPEGRDAGRSCGAVRRALAARLRRLPGAARPRVPRGWATPPTSTGRSSLAFATSPVSSTSPSSSPTCSAAPALFATPRRCVRVARCARQRRRRPERSRAATPRRPSERWAPLDELALPDAASARRGRCDPQSSRRVASRPWRPNASVQQQTPQPNGRGLSPSSRSCEPSRGTYRCAWPWIPFPDMMIVRAA